MAKEKLEKFWNDIHWMDETKVEMSAHRAQRHLWRKPNMVYLHKHLLATVKHRCGDLVWFAATTCGKLVVSKNTINVPLFRNVLETNVRPAGSYWPYWVIKQKMKRCEEEWANITPK